MHQPDAERAAATDGDSRLPALVSRIARRVRLAYVVCDDALRIDRVKDLVIGIELGDAAGQPVWFLDDREDREQAEVRHCSYEITLVEPGHVEHDRRRSGPHG